MGSGGRPRLGGPAGKEGDAGRRCSAAGDAGDAAQCTAQQSGQARMGLLAISSACLSTHADEDADFWGYQ